MTAVIFKNFGACTTFLTLQNGRLEGHTDRIWEEMKHFSVVLYVLFGAPFVIRDIPDLSNSIWLIIFPILAISVAVIAALIIHKESKDFLDALGTVLSIEKRLKFHEEYVDEIPKMIVSKDRKKKLKIKKDTNDESIDDFIERNHPIICKLDSISTRSWFEFYFIALIIFGLIEIGYITKYWYN
jgi:hypothetical protein